MVFTFKMSFYIPLAYIVCSNDVRFDSFLGTTLAEGVAENNVFVFGTKLAPYGCDHDLAIAIFCLRPDNRVISVLTKRPKFNSLTFRITSHI